MATSKPQRISLTAYRPPNGILLAKLERGRRCRDCARSFHADDARYDRDRRRLEIKCRRCSAMLFYCELAA
jgi:hypothetical protein